MLHIMGAVDHTLLHILFNLRIRCPYKLPHSYSSNKVTLAVIIWESSYNRKPVAFAGMGRAQPTLLAYVFHVFCSTPYKKRACYPLYRR